MMIIIISNFFVYIFKWFLDIIDQRFKNVVMHFIRQLFQLLFAVVFNLAQIFFNGFLHNWFDLERGFDCLVVLLVNSMRQGGKQKKIRTGKDTVENNEPCTSSTMSSSMSAGSNIPSPIFESDATERFDVGKKPGEKQI